MNLNATRTVRDLATEMPNATRIFEQLGIDYCCGGSKSLAEACASAHVSVEDTLHALEHDRPGGPAGASNADLQDFAGESLAGMIEYIVTRHHGYVRRELPRLHQLLNKVVSVHGKKHPELGRIRQTFQAMSLELSSHMMKEEEILFPHIQALEEAVGSGRPRPRPPFGAVSNPVRMMELEHDSAGAALRTISALSGNYTPPEDGCFSFRTLYAALKEFETDLHQHVHLENNVLFPRAIGLEGSAA